MSYNILNCTPHPIHLLDENNNIIHTFEPMALAIRIEQVIEPSHSIDVRSITTRVPLTYNKYGKVTSLPDQTTNTKLIVSRFVREAVPERADLLVPNELVRDENGRIIGCKSFAIN